MYTEYILEKSHPYELRDRIPVSEFTLITTIFTSII